MAILHPPTLTPVELPAQTERRLPRAQLKGRQAQPAQLDAVRATVTAALGALPWRRDWLIEALHALNDAHGALFEGHIVALAKLMRLTPVEVYEVASFYHHFHILRDDATAPALTLRVCASLSCQMAGSEQLLQGLANCLPTNVQVERVPCIGRCEQAPAAWLPTHGIGHATPEKLADAVTQASKEAKTAVKIIANDAIQPLTRQANHYAVLREVVAGERGAEAVIQTLSDAGLRGLGGAGFPLGRKWGIVRAQSAPRWLAVNIDEGEPGTFKDRFYLERDPHRFLEGMLIAAHVVGCGDVVIYLRDEYPECRAILQQALADLHADPPCDLPRIQLRRGAGAYICGEESAMLQSIEGQRGEPRLRPPYIAEVGLFGRPTLEHNFESLYWVPEILQRGAAWWTSHGRNGRTGLRSYSVSGRVRKPGVNLAPAGITLRELVDEFCGGMAQGHQLYGYLPGGASGGIFPASLADVPLDFDTLQPHGGFIGSAAVVVLSQHDRARDAALNTMRFFADESCGQCTPCRVGTTKAAALMESSDWDTATLNDLCTVMADASICGLGQAAPNPIQTVLRYFPNEVTKQSGGSA